MYDIENKNEQSIYTNKLSEGKNVEIINFDVDIEKGFLICQESDNSTERLVVVNLNKNSRRILAKTQGMFELCLKYPQVVFGRDIKDINPYYDAIAEKACYYIKERETIYIGGTSIDYLMIKHLPLNIKYTVITNSIITADELRKFENVDVYIMPGKVRGHGNMRDSLTLQFLQNIKIDLAFIAGPCISSQFGLSNTSFEAASLQTAVMNSARETIWLIPNTKFGVESLSKIADIKDISRIITDCEAVEDEVEKIRNQGIDIVIV